MDGLVDVAPTATQIFRVMYAFCVTLKFYLVGVAQL